MPRLRRTLFTIGLAVLLPLIVGAQEPPTVDSDAFNTRLVGVYSEYRAALRNIESQRPLPPNLDASIYPRYRGLRQSLDAGLRSSRILSLSEPLDVVQRISPTFVIVTGFDAPATGLRFCDNDICKYRGRIFVHRQQASVANTLAPGWLRYEGLRSYTTVLGAPDTIPEFSEVTLDGYPNITSEQRQLRNFRPSNAEQKQYAEPLYQRYRKNVDEYYAKMFQLCVDHLKKRLDVFEQVAKPFYGAKLVMVQFNGLRPMHVPESMVESLHSTADTSNRDTQTLTEEIGRVLRSKDQNIAIDDFLKYTQAWIRLSEAKDCSNTNPDVRSASQEEGERNHWEANYGVWSVNESYQPWCTSLSWIRFGIPRLGDDGRPTLPDWWGQYQQERVSR